MSDLDLIYGTTPQPAPTPAKPPTPRATPAGKRRAKKEDTRRTAATPSRSTGQSTSQSARQSINQPVNQSINRPINQPINVPLDTSSVIAKPKGFYISYKQDEDLDEAVKKLSKKLEGKALVKIDRSTILRLVLEDANLASDDTIERLSKQLIHRLINQLTTT